VGLCFRGDPLAPGSSFWNHPKRNPLGGGGSFDQRIDVLTYWRSNILTEMIYTHFSLIKHSKKNYERSNETYWHLKATCPYTRETCWRTDETNRVYRSLLFVNRSLLKKDFWIPKRDFWTHWRDLTMHKWGKSYIWMSHVTQLVFTASSWFGLLLVLLVSEVWKREREKIKREREDERKRQRGI